MRTLFLVAMGMMLITMGAAQASPGPVALPPSDAGTDLLNLQPFCVGTGGTQVCCRGRISILGIQVVNCN